MNFKPEPVDSLIPPQLSEKECIDYLEQEGITKYFPIGNDRPYSVFDGVNQNNSIPFYPVPYDLYMLHKLVRSRKVFNVLEFGVGYSTIVFADALAKNQKDFENLSQKIEIRIRDPFKIFSVDASKEWIDLFFETYKDFPHLDKINIQYSKCNIGEYNGQICHYYETIPDVVTDFIYLDGPVNDDVEGEINGISFKNCPERTVMSADLLKLEPTFLPGTMIAIDERQNNARFLVNNFRRKYSIILNENQGMNILELTEPPLGIINKTQIDYSLGDSYYRRLYTNSKQI